MKGEGAGLVWDGTNLAEYLADPGLKNPDDVKNVIAYLKSIQMSGQLWPRLCWRGRAQGASGTP
ncbi:Cytochrome c2 (fragment) [Mesorhizobium delmotii]|uniref:Cytochrome c2 n=1 Tax=Mesorhizobium delmotii TaxID=1631247 RepID=A0A2P9AMZ8_9HYPH